ncbi:MAG: DUF3793 family protein [Christensenellales bacterium]
MQYNHQPCHLLARHCGAVLLGKKPAGLFSIEDDSDMIDSVGRLAQTGSLKTAVLHSERGRALLLVYSPQLLEQALSHKTARKMLERFEYPQEIDTELLLSRLKERIGEDKGFPHEIGFFLGYPPADVVGFIIYGGKNSKHSCMWKVYGSVEAAKSLCALYRECQAFCSSHLESFGELPTLAASFEAN